MIGIDALLFLFFMWWLSSKKEAELRAEDEAALQAEHMRAIQENNAAVIAKARKSQVQPKGHRRKKAKYTILEPEPQELELFDLEDSSGDAILIDPKDIQ